MSLQHFRTNAPPFVRRFPPGEAERGREEARLLTAAAHPGVTELLAVRDEPDGSLELWLRRLPGPDLAHLRPLALEEACGLGAAMATTVADLHHLGIVHGDLAGSRVLLGEDGQPVLCGFDRAGLVGDDA
ncbi:MAG: protein kinase family protein [Acidimicrobiales bacterium]